MTDSSDGLNRFQYRVRVAASRCLYTWSMTDDLDTAVDDLQAAVESCEWDRCWLEILDDGEYIATGSAR